MGKKRDRTEGGERQGMALSKDQFAYEEANDDGGDDVHDRREGGGWRCHGD